MNNIGQREFKRIIKAAGVKPITFHGLRHTCATLLLKAGVPLKAVQERLGHKRIEITLNTYAHVLINAVGCCIEDVHAPAHMTARIRAAPYPACSPAPRPFPPQHYISAVGPFPPVIRS